MDLIDRKKAIDELKQEVAEMYHRNCLYHDQWKGVLKAVNIIKDMPSAEPERKKGKWLMAGEDEREQIVWVECSECGQALSWMSNYCPNCGADMRGDQDG